MEATTTTTTTTTTTVRIRDDRWYSDPLPIATIRRELAHYARQVAEDHVARDAALAVIRERKTVATIAEASALVASIEAILHTSLTLDSTF